MPPRRRAGVDLPPSSTPPRHKHSFLQSLVPYESIPPTSSENFLSPAAREPAAAMAPIPSDIAIRAACGRRRDTRAGTRSTAPRPVDAWRSAGSWSRRPGSTLTPPPRKRPGQARRQGIHAAAQRGGGRASRSCEPAPAKGRDQVVKILLEHGADPNRVIENVLPPLLMGFYGEWLECMKLLVEAGADVNVKGPTGQTVLLSAVDEGVTDIVKFLLEAGADPNIDDGGEFPIMSAAAHKNRELVEILFPRTKPIPSLPDWSVDGIIRTMKYMKAKLEAKNSIPVKESIAKWKSEGKEAFVKGDYFTAVHFYGLAIGFDSHDATLFSNRSLCWLRQREGELALVDAQYCTTLRPDWSKAWYREGAALSFLRDYKRAADAFAKALKLDPASDEIKKAFRETLEAMRSDACCEAPPDS